MKRFIIITLLILSGCSAGNLDSVKSHAAETWKQNGFEIVGYEGYQLSGIIPFTSYGGACVWYRVKPIPDNGIIYDGCLMRWGDEYHLYSLAAIDAIKPMR